MTGDDTVVSLDGLSSSGGNAYDVTETGDDSALTYSETVSGDSSSTDAHTGNDFIGTYTLTHDSSSNLTTTETGENTGESTLDYTLTQTTTNSQNYTETGDELSGDYTRTGSESSTTVNDQFSNAEPDRSFDGSAYYSETLAQQDSLSVSGNYQTGELTITLTGTRSHDLQDFGGADIPGAVDSGQGYSVSETSTDGFTQTETSDTDSGANSITEYDLTTYSLAETNSVLGTWSLSENGVEILTFTQTGNSVSGGYSQSATATDDYTLIQTGTVSAAAYSESVTGQDDATQQEWGNTIADRTRAP